MSIRTIISSLDFFKSLNDEHIEILAKMANVTAYKQNYVLHYEQQQSKALLFLVKGLAKAYKIDKHDNEIFLYNIYENSLLSEISSMQDEYLHSFSNIQLIEDSKILSINYSAFKKEFLSKHLLCSEFANEIINRSIQLQSLVNREFIFDSVSKVAMMIDEDIAMFNKLKRHDISLILHIQPATLSRVLNRLKRNKIIDIIHGKITIIDHRALRSVYKDEHDDSY